MGGPKGCRQIEYPKAKFGFFAFITGLLMLVAKKSTPPTVSPCPRLIRRATASASAQRGEARQSRGRGRAENGSIKSSIVS